jgi:hypothetical protein
MLPNNEWIAYKQGSLYYNSSSNGDQYAGIRINNNSFNWKQLIALRKKYKHDNWYTINDQKENIEKSQFPLKKNRKKE